MLARRGLKRPDKQDAKPTKVGWVEMRASPPTGFNRFRMN
jgi:hypothetical protein